MSIADVILIRPQEHDYDYLQWHEDINVAYALSILENDGIRCRVFDFALRPLLSVNDYKQAVSQIVSVRAPLIVLVIDKHPTNSPYYACEFIQKLREDTLLKNTHISVYGNTQIGSERLLFQLPIDSIVTGEELDFLAFTKAILNFQPIDEIPGVSFRDAMGKICTNPPLPRLVNLDELPFPRRYFFELPSEERNKYGYVGAILASRGCYAKCTFCYIRAKEAVHGSYGWIGRTPKNVVDEMEILYRDYNTREFAFLDPQFFGPGNKGQKWGQELAQEIINRGLKDIAFSIYARANDIKPETIELLREAGLYAVFIGIESFSQNVLDRYKKGLTVEDNIHAIKILMDYGIRLRMGFISFDHFTTLDELKESISQLKSICEYRPYLITQPVFFQNILSPLDDTPAGNEYKELGASGLEVKYEFNQLITTQQKRLSRNGVITIFADQRVAYISEATRILASEILQRTTNLETQASDSLFNKNNKILISDRNVAFSNVLSWFDNLTSFAVSEFEKIFNSFSDIQTPAPMQLSEIAEIISEDCKNYDFQHIGFTLEPERPVRTAIFD